jgi:hypothetical protein
MYVKRTFLTNFFGLIGSETGFHSMNQPEVIKLGVVHVTA